MENNETCSEKTITEQHLSLDEQTVDNMCSTVTDSSRATVALDESHLIDSSQTAVNFDKSHFKSDVTSKDLHTQEINNESKLSTLPCLSAPDCDFSSCLVDRTTISPPLEVTTFSALNDSNNSSCSSSDEEEKFCAIEQVQKNDDATGNILKTEGEPTNEIETKPLSSLTNTSLLNAPDSVFLEAQIKSLSPLSSVTQQVEDVVDSTASPLLSPALQQMAASSPNSVVASALGETTPITAGDDVASPTAAKASTSQSEVASSKKHFSGLDDVLFNLADIPVESYSARQRSTINSEHQKEEARAQRQREREAERQEQAATAAARAAAVSAQKAMHSSAVGMHHTVAHQHPSNVCHALGNVTAAARHTAPVPNPYAAHSMHYGGPAAATALQHLQPHHTQTQPAVQFHPHQQYSATQQQPLMPSQQQMQAQTQHSVPPSAYPNYGLPNQVAAGPDFSAEYGSAYSSSSSQMHPSAHHGAPHLPPPPPAHQQLQPEQLTQPHHSVSAPPPPLPHQPSHQQSLLSLQQVHKQSSTPQQIHQQPLTPQQMQPLTPQQLHQPVKVLTPTSVVPSPGPPPQPSSVSPPLGQPFQQSLSLTQSTPPLGVQHQSSAQTSPDSASNASGGGCGASSASEHQIKSVRVTNGVVSFPCKMCNKVYNNRSSLRSHVKKHYPEEEKPFKCQQCSYSSHYRANLMKHMDTNHNEVSDRWLCEYCQKSFSNETEMREHLKLHNVDGSITHK